MATYKPRPCIIIPADSAQPVRVVHEQSCELKALQALVGGDIELVPLARSSVAELARRYEVNLNGAQMYAHESGRFEGLPYNARAVEIAGVQHVVYGICGDVFVMRVP